MQYQHISSPQEPSGRLHIAVQAPDPLPALPAAVEVATYRIAQEAITNVTRHAHARTCLVRLQITHALRLEIIDDGIGLPMNVQRGVGLTSMRERAVELGGTYQIEALPTGGTRVLARLPLPKGQLNTEKPRILQKTVYAPSDPASLREAGSLEERHQLKDGKDELR